MPSWGRGLQVAAVSCCAVVAVVVAALPARSPGPTADRDIAAPAGPALAASTERDPASAGSGTGTELATASGWRPFAATSPWNQPIPAGSRPVAGSAAMVTRLSSAPALANIYDYGVPVYRATASTPRLQVTCTKRWGPCELEAARVPIPVGARPSRGSDGAMVVIDEAARRSYEFWQYRYNDGRPTVSWGDTSRLDGNGRDSTAVGAGVSRLAGVVRTDEVRRGVIDHALVFSTKWCAQGRVRYPATKTDGTFSGIGAVPEAARVQLDPAVLVDRLPGITPLEKAVAKALQRYGAYNIDCGGAPMAFVFEAPFGESDPYRAAGMVDYQALRHIPWDRLRVVAPPGAPAR